MMNERYKLVESGGYHGEIILREMDFDSLTAVGAYLDTNNVKDINGDDASEGLYDFLCWEEPGPHDENIKRVFLIDEGLELVELA